MNIDPKTLSPRVQKLIAKQTRSKNQQNVADYLAGQRKSGLAETYRLERDLIKDVLALLTSLDIFAWRNNTGSAGKGKGFVRFGYRGSADILGILAPSGRFLAIELKAKGKDVTDEQAAFINRIIRAGGVAGACWTLNDVRRLCKGAKR